MHDTGEKLRGLGCPDLSRFVMDVVRVEPPSAVRVVEALAATFRHFEDVERLDDVQVVIRKKAVFLAAELYHRCREVGQFAHEVLHYQLITS